MTGKCFGAVPSSNLQLHGLGWSPGSLSNTHFDWVRNFKNQHLPDVAKDRYKIESAAALALFWNMTRSIGPHEVVDDVEGWIQRSGINTMDPGLEIHGVNRSKPTNQYAVPVQDEMVVFDDAHLAPPQGACAVNYGR